MMTNFNLGPKAHLFSHFPHTLNRIEIDPNNTGLRLNQVQLHLPHSNIIEKSETQGEEDKKLSRFLLSPSNQGSIFQKSQLDLFQYVCLTLIFQHMHYFLGIDHLHQAR